MALTLILLMCVFIVAGLVLTLRRVDRESGPDPW